ncbi:type III restriction enzyme [Fodinibius roseus]|uniref:Type III restriction enzyme n=1 Tax=Fodinibius roseus TaxID=1194090 RepID=A0A1M5JZZ9_9BACT|nr:DEAD/DEAH box helicase family protein [Fodinibius roseus]SHG45880.1 type III restriction enzyme [Fodinibius roseus]
MEEELLYKDLQTYKKFAGEDVYKKQVPSYIPNNLAPMFQLRPYQQEAFGRYIYYLNKYDNRPKGQPLQNLFHMATGSGKTLIMAGLLLFLYEEGYRNFLFFVDSSNIINKTRENFLNNASNKYLFADDIQIGEKRVRVREVDNFSSSHPDDINIIFTTIQGLHSRLNTPRENSVTYEDFEDEKVVLISDEAHHINAETKKGYKLLEAEKENITSWEQTVFKIFNSHDENILLEFTATIDLGNPDIKKKYQDKIIMDYPLKEFRKDGYSKEVKVLQADLEKFERAIQAIILSQYRRKVFADHQILIKPVILFKSRIIKDSEAFYEKFKTEIKDLSGNDLQQVKNNPSLDPILKEAFQYFEDKSISLENLAQEIREEFSEDKCLTINSKSESEEKQIAVNTLEDDDNEYRGIFAVDKLNEGWDVLNLFDIVRLYNTRDAKSGRPGKTTMSEAQLIGRGARYCPFQLNEEQPLYQRKYDIVGDEEEYELKICEELYYHSAHNPRYIDELNTALEEVGIKAKRNYQVSLNLKPSFKQSPTYKKGYIYTNQKKKYKREDIKSLDEHAQNHLYKVKLRTGYMVTTTIYEDTSGKQLKTARQNYKIADFGERIVKKALNRLQFYYFSNLKNYFPHLTSHTEFINSEDYLARVEVEVTGVEDRLNNLSPTDKLDITVQVLDELASKIKSGTVEYKGTKDFQGELVSEVISDKEISVAKDEGDDRYKGIPQTDPQSEDLMIPLGEKEWYAFNDNFGTSEEKKFVKYIDKVYEKLEPSFDEIYLVRNESHFTIYNFEDGKGFEPDFVLFLKKEDPEKSLHYQIFIEPKGDHLLEHDEWKEEFLEELKDDYDLIPVWRDKEYILWGLPFYNENKRRREFEKEFEKIISV